MRYSHQPMGGLLDGVRRELQSGTEREGLRRAIELLAGPAQLFPALRSWARAPERDDRVILVRYEDLTGQDAAASFGKLFAHCDIRLTPKTLSELLEDYSFEKMSGRRQGAEDVGSHFRKGRAGDWKEHFDGDLMRHFRAVTGDLLEVLNYD